MFLEIIIGLRIAVTSDGARDRSPGQPAMAWQAIQPLLSLFRSGWNSDEAWRVPSECEVLPSESADGEGVVSASERMTGGSRDSLRVWVPSEYTLRLRVTIRASTFVQGPKGVSANLIESVTGADIYTFNLPPDPEVRGMTRQFFLVGPRDKVRHTADLICRAVLLYKELTEGSYEGRAVPRIHKLDGILYRYCSPAAAANAAPVLGNRAEIEVLQANHLTRSERHHRLVRIRNQLKDRDEDFIRSKNPRCARLPARNDSWQQRRREFWSMTYGEPAVLDHDAMLPLLTDGTPDEVVI